MEKASDVRLAHYGKYQTRMAQDVRRKDVMMMRSLAQLMCATFAIIANQDLPQMTARHNAKRHTVKPTSHHSRLVLRDQFVPVTRDTPNPIVTLKLL